MKNTKTAKERLVEKLAELEEIAKQATPGNWSRNHGVITSTVRNPDVKAGLKAFDRHLVALTDFHSLSRNRIYVGREDNTQVFYEPDPTKDGPNGRLIMATSPGRTLSLIELIRAVLLEEEIV